MTGVPCGAHGQEQATDSMRSAFAKSGGQTQLPATVSVPMKRLPTREFLLVSFSR